MKKILILAAMSVIICSAHAGWDMFKPREHNKDSEIYKKEWLTQRQKVSKKQGKKYNEKQAMKTFKMADTDDSVTLSREEVEALQASWEKIKK